MRAESRWQAIREILAHHRVATQEELRRHLLARGVRVAQATLSRDMARLGVRRATGVAGPRYEIRGDDGALPVESVRILVESVTSNGLLVVVRTKAGAASTVARAIDDARLPGVLGSLAGDDTIFVAPASASARGGRGLVRRLEALLAASSGGR